MISLDVIILDVNYYSTKDSGELTSTHLGLFSLHIAQACKKAQESLIQGTQGIFFLPAWIKDLLSQGHILPGHLLRLTAESEGGGGDTKWTHMDVRCSCDVYSPFCPGFPKRLLCRRNNVDSFLDFAPEVTQSASGSQVLAGD